jgi:chromosome segregation ATPase
VLGILKPYRVAPDDTPTRQLTDVEKQVEKTPSGRLVLEQLWKAEDDVSRLQQELHEKNQAGMHAVTEISRLQQENALLRRSLEMLTKQLNEQDERITELTFTIIRANSPA